MHPGQYVWIVEFVFVMLLFPFFVSGFNNDRIIVDCQCCHEWARRFGDYGCWRWEESLLPATSSSIWWTCSGCQSFTFFDSGSGTSDLYCSYLMFSVSRCVNKNKKELKDWPNWPYWVVSIGLANKFIFVQFYICWKRKYLGLLLLIYLI